MTSQAVTNGAVTTGSATTGPLAAGPAANGIPIADVPALMEMSVNDMVAATGLEEILQTPVGDILADLGLVLPELPAMAPLPGLPPLPVIDIGLLVKPITDLLGGFGTGNLGTANIDPTAIFSGLSTVLESSATMAQGALTIADALWSGQTSVAAAGKTAEAAVNGGQLATQGSGMSFDIQAAAGIVAAGLAVVQGILAATIAKITAAVPLVPSGAGLPLMGGFAAEGLAEASAAVALTRSQLLAPTAHMTVNGAPVPVTPAPVPAGGATQSPFALAAGVLEALTPMLSAAVEVPAALSAPLVAALGARDTSTRTTPAGYTTTPDGDVPGGGPGPSGAGALGAGVLSRAAGTPMGAGGGLPGSVTAPLSAARPSSTTTVIGTTEPAGLTQPAAVKTVAAGAAPMPGAMAPMAAAGAARAAGAQAEGHETPDYLITEDNGHAVVGEVADVAPAVLGARDLEAEPGPDVELRLDLPGLR